MKFPLINNKKMIWSPTFNKKGKCSLCGKKPKDGAFVALNGGAMKGDKNGAEASSDIVGFLTLHLHDRNKRKGGWLDIVNLSPCGQFDFYLCSPKCLRKFFDKIVDAFEETLK